MSDIYGANPTFGGAFSSDQASLVFTSEGDAGLGLLTQGLQATYARPIQRIFELGDGKTQYYVIGRAEGTLNITRLAAPGPVSISFLTKFADPCNVKHNNISITVNAGTLEDCPIEGSNAGPSKYQFGFCLINNLGFSISTQAIALQEQVSMMFASMSNDAAGGSGSGGGSQLI